MLAVVEMKISVLKGESRGWIAPRLIAEAQAQPTTVTSGRKIAPSPLGPNLRANKIVELETSSLLLHTTSSPPHMHSGLATPPHPQHDDNDNSSQADYLTH